MATDIGTLRGLLVLDDKFSASLAVAGSKLDQAGKKWDSVGAKMTAAGGSLTRSLTLPMALAAGGALKLSADFETSLTKIETLVGLSATRSMASERTFCASAERPRARPRSWPKRCFSLHRPACEERTRSRR